MFGDIKEDHSINSYGQNIKIYIWSQMITLERKYHNKLSSAKKNSSIPNKLVERGRYDTDVDHDKVKG